MNVQEMCEAAARNTDRYDEFVLEQGAEDYEDDAAHYKKVFLDGINEAYFAASRQMLSPAKIQLVTVPDDQIIDLTTLDPPAFQIRALLNALKTENIPYFMIDRDHIQVTANAGASVNVFYHHMPDRLVELDETPVFSAAAVDPEVYINMASARMWLSEKKPDLGQPWLQRFYNGLRGIKSVKSNLIIGRRLWR